MSTPAVTAEERILRAQESAVACALWGEGGKELLTRLEPRSFSDERLRALWTYMVDAHREERLTIDEVRTHPVGGEAWLVGMMELGLGSDWASVLDAVRASSLMSEALVSAKALGESMALLPVQLLDAQAAVQNQMRRLTAALDGSQATEDRADLLEGADEFAADAVDGGGDVVCTYGLPSLDRMVGGLRAGTMHVILAASSHGKSMLALQAAIRAAEQGVPVLYASCEMLEKEIAGRVACHLARMRKADLQSAIRRSDPTVAQTMERLARLPIVVDSTSRSVAALEARVARGAAGKPFGMVVVDYLQEYRDQMVKEDHLAIESAARACKNLSLRQGVPVLVPVQVNRATDQTAPPRMADGRGSSGIENAADTVLGMLKVPQHSGPDLMQFALRKARNGQSGFVDGEVEMRGEQYWMREVLSEETVL